MLAGWTRRSSDMGKIAATKAMAMPPAKMAGKTVSRGVTEA
jgi:hypothetical protein